MHIRLQSDLDNWLSTQHIEPFLSDLCVQKRFFGLRNVRWFLWQCLCVVMLTLKTTITAIQFAKQMLSYNMTMLPSRSFIFHLMRHGRNTGSWNVRFYSVLPSPLVSKLNIPAVYCLCLFPLDMHFATTQACFCKDIKHVFYKNLWHVYVLRHKTTWKIYAKSYLTSQTKTDFQECNRNPKHMNVALNRFAKTDLM